MAGIYIHIPFCRKACHYCSFHFSTNLHLKSQLVNALKKELYLRKHEIHDMSIQSIYFGGGTPSVLSFKELEEILETIRNNYDLSEQVEVTIEANPEDISFESLKQWKILGINRLSVGIQSFIDRDLIYMNRSHDAQQSKEALKLISNSEFENVSIDLMFGLINSELEEWKENLDMVKSYRITHLSVYNLTIEEQTVFANWKAKKSLLELPESYQEDQFKYASEHLKARGFEHYEISNYSLPGYQSIHNTNYWKRVTYLGFGPSAHSYKNQQRYWNESNNSKYLKMIDSDTFTQESESLDLYDIYNEMIMLGLRTSKGIEMKDILTLPKEIQTHFEAESKPLLKENILVKDQNNITLTKNNWYISDSVASQLFITKQ